MAPGRGAARRAERRQIRRPPDPLGVRPPAPAARRIPPPQARVPVRAAPVSTVPVTTFSARQRSAAAPPVVAAVAARSPTRAPRKPEGRAAAATCVRVQRSQIPSTHGGCSCMSIPPPLRASTQFGLAAPGPRRPNRPPAPHCLFEGHVVCPSEPQVDSAPGVLVAVHASCRTRAAGVPAGRPPSLPL
jgi:hypothetical protein